MWALVHADRLYVASKADTNCIFLSKWLWMISDGYNLRGNLCFGKTRHNYFMNSSIKWRGIKIQKGENLLSCNMIKVTKYWPMKMTLRRLFQEMGSGIWHYSPRYVCVCVCVCVCGGGLQILHCRVQRKIQHNRWLPSNFWGTENKRNLPCGGTQNRRTMCTPQINMYDSVCACLFVCLYVCVCGVCVCVYLFVFVCVCVCF